MDPTSLQGGVGREKYAEYASIAASLDPLLAHLSLTTDVFGGARSVMLATCILSKKDVSFVRSTLEQLIYHKHHAHARPRARRFVAGILDAYARRITEACSQGGDAGLQAVVASSDVLVAVLGEVPAHADDLPAAAIQPALDALLDRCNDPAARIEDARVLVALVDMSVLSQTFEEQMSAMGILTPREGVNVLLRAGGRGQRDFLDAEAEGRRVQVAGLLEASRVLRAEARSQESVWHMLLDFVRGTITDAGLDWSLRAQAIIVLDEQVVETPNGFRALFETAQDLKYVWRVVDAAVRINRCGLFLQIDVDHDCRARVSNLVLAAVTGDTTLITGTQFPFLGQEPQQQELQGPQPGLDLQLVSLAGGVPHNWLSGRMKGLIDRSVDAVDITRGDILAARRILARQADLDRQLQRQALTAPQYEAVAMALRECDAAARFVINGVGSSAAAAQQVMACCMAV